MKDHVFLESLGGEVRAIVGFPILNPTITEG